MAIINRGERYHKLLPEASTKEFVTFAVYESKEIRDFEKSSQKEWDIFKKAVENKLAKYTEDSEIFDSSGLKSDNPADLKKYLQRGIEEYPLLTEKERSYFRNNYFVDESKLEDDLYNIFFEPVILNIGKEKALLERAFESALDLRESAGGEENILSEEYFNVLKEFGYKEEWRDKGISKTVISLPYIKDGDFYTLESEEIEDMYDFSKEAFEDPSDDL